MSKIQERSISQALPWAVILTFATLAIISAWLVFLESWQPWQAFLVVSAIATGIVLSLLAAILFLSPPDSRSALWRAFTSTFRSDLEIFLKYFRIRKRM